MSSVVNFEIWKSALRNNCEKEDKLPAFNSFDDFVLLLLFEQGIGPTPEAIIANGQKVA